MNITLFSNTSGANTLNKSITQLSNGIVGSIKDESNVVDPEIIISNTTNSNYPNFNYFYINEFNRYYYVTDKITEHGRMIIRGHVDVLMSFNSDIKNLTIVAERVSNANGVDFYQVDPEIPQKNYKNIKTKLFPNGFSESNSFVLVAAGG